MKYGLFLIDRAVEMCEPKSRYELAKRTGIAESHLSAVANGKRPFPAGWTIRLAEVAGISPAEALLRVMAEKGAKKPSLRTAGGAAMLLISYGSSVGHHPKFLAAVTACLDCLRIVSIKAPSLFVRARSPQHAI